MEEQNIGFLYLKDKSVEELMSLIEETEADKIFLEKTIEKTKNSNEITDLRSDIKYDKDLINACKKYIEIKSSENVK